MGSLAKQSVMDCSYLTGLSIYNGNTTKSGQVVCNGYNYLTGLSIYNGNITKSGQAVYNGGNLLNVLGWPIS